MVNCVAPDPYPIHGHPMDGQLIVRFGVKTPNFDNTLVCFKFKVAYLEL